MLLRPTVFALVLAVGTAVSAPAQSAEYPFRRFRLQATPHLRFSLDNAFRLKTRAEGLRKLAVERSHALAERARSRQLAQWDREFTLRNRALDLQDRAHRRALELRFREMDRIHDRLDRFKFTRPLRIKRHSRII